MSEPVHLAANNADLGGGEQMVVRTAEALLGLGRAAVVVAPDAPTDVLDAAAALGAGTVAIRADSRRDYLRRLRAWDRRERTGLLWCHGLLPSLATAGHGNRIVHLHQLPRSRTQLVALSVARRGADRVLTPSSYLSSQVAGASTFLNWTDDVLHAAGRESRVPLPVGFLGRLSTDKGLDVLASALDRLGSGPDLVAAGDNRWVPDDQRAVVSRALRELGDRVEVVGRTDPATFFDLVGLAVFPSRVPESFGLVVAEAMAAGVPFVASDAGALPEVAGPGHPWVARAGDVDDLARVINDALGATDDVRTASVDAARARWEAEYSPDAGRRRVAALLKELGV